MQRALVWFRRDLRVRDNPALAAAAAAAGQVLPVYILDEATGAAGRWWLHHSLRALRESLARRGLPLALRRGRPAEVLRGLAAEHRIEAAFWNRVREPAWARADAAAERALADCCDVHAFPDDSLTDPAEIATGQGAPYRVFTAYWRRCRELLEARPPEVRGLPRRAAPVPGAVSERLDDWRLLPRAPDWAARFDEHGAPGEAAARARWAAFIGGGAAGYADGRDVFAAGAGSGLSAPLHFGEVSPRAVWRDALRARDAGAGGARDLGRFLDQLGWREFSRYLLHHFPATAAAPFREKFAAFPWRRDAAAFARWRRGRTGYPLVDAGMRELRATGFMHNRARMVCASFLSKHLLLDWRLGADWFLDALVDADVANNTAGWQWAAGCGADAAPYFRIFSPAAQAAKHDPRGAYVRRWVPELAALPDRHLAAPCAAPAAALRAAGVVPGETYPPPMVEHAAARRRALAAYRSL